MFAQKCLLTSKMVLIVNNLWYYIIKYFMVYKTGKNTFNGVSYQVKREQKEKENGEKHLFEFETAAHVGGKKIITKSELHSRGIQEEDIPSWEAALETFTISYIKHKSIEKGITAIKYHYSID